MITTKSNILLIEDDPEIRRFLRAHLKQMQFSLQEGATGKEGLNHAARETPDVVILDLELPDMDGVEVLTRLRAWSHVPVIILSARDAENDKVRALDAGADDYLTKPFGVAELDARVRVALRRAQSRDVPELPIFSFGNITIDRVSRVVKIDGIETHLSPTEYKLLHLLVQNAGKVVTQHQILRDVWGPGYAKEGHYLRVYMAQLRRKLEKDPARPKYLLTEPGVGCRLKAD